MPRERTNTKRDETFDRACRAYVAEGGNSNAASRASGIPQRTIYKYITSAAGKVRLAEIAKECGGGDLAKRLLDFASRGLARLDEEMERGDLTGRDLAVAIGIAVDKSRALRALAGGDSPGKQLKILRVEFSGNRGDAPPLIDAGVPSAAD